MRREIFLSFFQDRCKSFSLTISHSRIHGITGGKKKRKRITNRCIRRIPPLYVKQYWLVTSVELNLTPFRVSFNSNLSIIAPLLNIISQRKKRYLFFSGSLQIFFFNNFSSSFSSSYSRNNGEKKEKKDCCIILGTPSLCVKQHWLVTSVELNLTPFRVSFNSNLSIIAPLLNIISQRKKRYLFFQDHCKSFSLTISHPHFHSRIHGITGEKKEKREPLHYVLNNID